MKVGNPGSNTVLRRSRYPLTPWRAVTAGLFGLTLTVVLAQYEIAWHSITPASTGSGYSLVGRVEQPDWSQMTNGPYGLSTGLAGFPFVLPAVTPTLGIVATVSNVVIVSWSPDEPGWTLQESSSLSPADWSDSPSQTNPATLTIGAGKKFYRLVFPPP